MIYVFAESQNNKIKKATKEAVSYASELAKELNDKVCTIALESVDNESLALYGADEVINLTNADFAQFSPQVYAKALAGESQSGYWILPGSSQAMAIAPFLAHELNIALITNVLESPMSVSPLKLKRKSFSGKGIQHVQLKGDSAIILLTQNAFGLIENQKDANVQSKESAELPQAKITQTEFEETGVGKLDVKEAEIVVSAGRGLKAPENWAMVEELADLLGAATACSKPVSDIGWRPHSEHVGQTGKAISPNLYIAIGISGAIQHLAGVSSSKTIVVINTDAEAPFFKAADYGIVGDAFDVVPKLIEEIRKVKSA